MESTMGVWPQSMFKAKPTALSIHVKSTLSEDYYRSNLAQIFQFILSTQHTAYDVTAFHCRDTFPKHCSFPSLQRQHTTHPPHLTQHIEHSHSSIRLDIGKLTAYYPFQYQQTLINFIRRSLRIVQTLPLSTGRKGHRWPDPKESR